LAPAIARVDGMPHLELIFLHSESADGCNARSVPAAPVSSDLKIARHLVAGWCQDREKTCHQFAAKISGLVEPLDYFRWRMRKAERDRSIKAMNSLS
jgi:hypothetical protein